MTEGKQQGAAKKVAIVGAAPSSRDLAPFKDETWEIWGCSPSNRDKIPRITTWFEIHDLHFLKLARNKAWTEPYVEWLKAQTFRVMMQEPNDLVPNAVAYPLDAALKLHNGRHNLLNSSISLMIANAMIEGASDIAIYGVDMAADSEWAYELPGCHVWIDKARAMGINVYVPDESSLDTPIPIYGFGDATPKARKLREQVAELTARRDLIASKLHQSDAEKAQLLRQHYHMDGAIEATNWIRKTWESWSGPDLA